MQAANNQRHETGTSIKEGSVSTSVMKTNKGSNERKMKTIAIAVAIVLLSSIAVVTTVLILNDESNNNLGPSEIPMDDHVVYETEEEERKRKMDRYQHPKETIIVESKPISINVGLEVPKRNDSYQATYKPAREEVVDTIEVEGHVIPARYMEGRDCAGYLHWSVIQEAKRNGWCSGRKSLLCEVSGCLLRAVEGGLNAIDLIAAEKEDTLYSDEEDGTDYVKHAVRVGVEHMANNTFSSIILSMNPLLAGPLYSSHGPFAAGTDDEHGQSFLARGYGQDVMYAHTDRFWLNHNLKKFYNGSNAVSHLNVMSRASEVKEFAFYWRAEGCQKDVLRPLRELKPLRPYMLSPYCAPAFHAVTVNSHARGGLCLNVTGTVSGGNCGNTAYENGIVDNECTSIPQPRATTFAIGADGYAIWTVDLGIDPSLYNQFYWMEDAMPTAFAAQVKLEVFKDDSLC